MKTETETDIDVCKISDIEIEITGEGSQPLIDAINSYLEIFAKPVKREGGSSLLLGGLKCLKCDVQLDGAMGSFQWGIANGEGTCSNCSWPARAYHSPKDDEGKIFDRPLEKILQYHPSGVMTKDTDEQRQVEITGSQLEEDE